MKMMNAKTRLIFLGAFSALSAILVFLHYGAGLGSDFFGGMGIGMFAVIVPVFLFFFIRTKNREFAEEYDLSMNDERIRNNIFKAEALGHKVLAVLVISCAVLSYATELDLFFSVLVSILISTGFSKIYAKYLNNGPSDSN